MAAFALILVACKSETQPSPNEPSSTVTEPKQAKPAEKSTESPTDAPLRLAADTATPVAELTRRLTSGAKTKAAGLRQLVGGIASRLEALLPTQPLGRPPYSPSTLATRLMETTDTIAVTSIESTGLLIAAATALGAKATPTLLLSERAGATSIRHRNYAADIQTDGFLGVYAADKSPVRDRTPNTPVAPKHFEALRDALGVLALTEERRFNDAEKALEALKHNLPTDAGVQFLEGHLALLQGQPARGIKALKAAVEAAPDPHGWYLLGIAHLQDESNFQAYEALQRAAKLDPAYAEVWAAIGALLMERWHNTPAEMREPLTKQLDEVEAALAKIGKDAFGLVELRIQRLEAKGKREKAKQLGAEALNMFPKRATLHLLMSELCAADGEISRMERHLERAAEVDREDAEPLMRLASLYAERNEPDRLIDALQSAAQRAPYDPDILDQLASTLQEAGKLPEAQKKAAELRDRFPELPLGYIRLAELSISTGNAIGAAALVETALEKSPKDGELHVLAYFAHTMANAPDKAAAVVAKYARFDKDARMKIAEPLLQAGQFEAAVQLLEQEVSLHPKRLEVVISLAQLHTLLKHPKAVARLRKLLQNQSDLPDGTIARFDEAVKQAEAQAAAAPPADDD